MARKLRPWFTAFFVGAFFAVLQASSVFAGRWG
jgi:hypothetical protein